MFRPPSYNEWTDNHKLKSYRTVTNSDSKFITIILYVTVRQRLKIIYSVIFIT